MAELREIILPVRINDRERLRQRLVGEVVIDHDGLHAEAARLGERIVARGAAIDRHQQRRAALASERTASTLVRSLRTGDREYG